MQEAIRPDVDRDRGFPLPFFWNSTRLPFRCIIGARSALYFLAHRLEGALDDQAERDTRAVGSVDSLRLLEARKLHERSPSIFFQRTRPVIYFNQQRPLPRFGIPSRG